MQALHFPFQLRESRGGGLDDQQMLARGLQFALPGVKRFDRATGDVNAPGEAPLYNGERNLAGKRKRWAGDEDDPYVSGFCAGAFSLRLFLIHGATIITAFSVWREQLK